jgi:hypothetical protein
MLERKMSRRYFDLNIQRVLEHWTVSEALREIIANALDEQALTNTAEPEIFETDSGSWHVRDFGRGLRHEHFTQNEDAEKLAKPNLVIGKFGVGLKDAMATFDRHRVTVVVRSKHSDITIDSVAKHGFDDILTLHAVVDDPADSEMVGTEFILSGLKREDVDTAKGFFLKYSGDVELEPTRYGSVLQREAKSARIYVNGLRVAEEPNFLFSYNITSLTKALRAALNRERNNVGRQAYTDRVKAILLACSMPSVADALAADLASFASGKNHDETTWLDVSVHACRVLNAHEKVVFVTADQVYMSAGLVTQARNDGYRVVVVPETVASKLPRLEDVEGNPLRDLNEYRDEWNRSFQYDFVDPEELTEAERAVFALVAPVLRIVGDEARRVREVLVSRTMRINAHDDHEAVGVWDEEARQIIIKRDQLNRPESFLATLLHEVAHASSRAPDIDEEFERALTQLLGLTAKAATSDAHSR